MNVHQIACEIEIANQKQDAESLILRAWIDQRDAGAQWVSSGVYRWYKSLGSVVRPKSMLEIGTRLGYSLMSIWSGFDGIEKIVSVDSERDIPGSQAAVSLKTMTRNKIYNTKADCRFFVADTKNCESFDAFGGPFDLIHLDGDHSFAGCQDDIVKALGVLADGGVIVVDDLRSEDVSLAVSTVAFLKNLELSIVHTWTKHAILKKK